MGDWEEVSVEYRGTIFGEEGVDCMMIVCIQWWTDCGSWLRVFHTEELTGSTSSHTAHRGIKYFILITHCCYWKVQLLRACIHSYSYPCIAGTSREQRVDMLRTECLTRRQEFLWIWSHGREVGGETVCSQSSQGGVHNVYRLLVSSHYPCIL